MRESVLLYIPCCVSIFWFILYSEYDIRLQFITSMDGTADSSTTRKSRGHVLCATSHALSPTPRFVPSLNTKSSFSPCKRLLSYETGLPIVTGMSTSSSAASSTSASPSMRLSRPNRKGGRPNRVNGIKPNMRAVRISRAMRRCDLAVRPV